MCSSPCLINSIVQGTMMRPIDIFLLKLMRHRILLRFLDRERRALNHKYFQCNFLRPSCKRFVALLSIDPTSYNTYLHVLCSVWKANIPCYNNKCLSAL